MSASASAYQPFSASAYVAAWRNVANRVIGINGSNQYWPGLTVPFSWPWRIGGSGSASPSANLHLAFGLMAHESG